MEAEAKGHLDPKQTPPGPSPQTSSQTPSPTPSQSTGLEALPSDVLLNILFRLTPETVASKVALLSRSFRALADSPSLWQVLCGNPSLTEEDAQTQGGWKSLFCKVFQTDLLCSPHFELLNVLQKEQEIYGLEPFKPERLSPWYLTNHSEFDLAEGNIGADPYWLGAEWKWMPWEYTLPDAARELRPVGSSPCPAAPWAPCLVTGNQMVGPYQRVGLRHFPKRFLDSRPPILVSAWYAGPVDCPSVFDLSIELKKDGNLKYRWLAGVLPDELPCPQNGWAKAQHLITDYPKGVDEIR